MIKTTKALVIALLAAFSISYSPVNLASGIATHLIASEEAVKQVNTPALIAILEKYPDALRSSTSFPDGGYPLDYRWAEPAHWAPFQNAYIQRIRSLCRGKYETNAYCGKLVAHLLGSVGHGFQDQVTDALLLPKIAQEDGTDSTADKDIDFFVIADYPNRQSSIPQTWFIPFFEIFYTFQDMGLGRVSWLEFLIGGSVIRIGMVGEFLIFPFAYADAIKNIPWARDNYITYPGGINQMSQTTARLYEYLWDRLNEDTPSNHASLMPFPAPGSAVPHNNTRTDSQIGVIADRGIIPNTVSKETFIVTDEDGNQVPGVFNMRASLSSTVAQSHLIIFYPSSPLTPNSRYAVKVLPGILDETGLPLVDDAGFEWEFETY